MIFQIPVPGQYLLAKIVYCNVQMEHIAIGTLKESHVAKTKREEKSAQRTIQLCARKKIVQQVEPIIVVRHSPVVENMVDPDSVNKRVSLREVIGISLETKQSV